MPWPCRFRFALVGLFAFALCQAVAPPAWAVDDDGAPTSLEEAFANGMSYRMVGPYRGGRVTAVAGVIQEPRTFYMGATGGGLWKTEDLGERWRNVGDGFLDTGSIGALAVAPSDPNVVWVGTGSACIRSNVIAGRGVWRSVDGGETWGFLGLSDAGAIGDVVVHPTDPDTAWLAVLGHPFGPSTERGVYKTIDGGETFERVLFVSDRTGAVDLTLDPRNPRRLFVAMWEAERKPWTIQSGGSEGGVWSTTDGGESWSKVGGGLPGPTVGRIAVEISPADPSRVWALVEAPGDGRGLWRSDDGGKQFVRVSAQSSLTNRPFYYTHLTADPNDRDKVWVSNESFWRSIDGGANFESVATPHGDHHALWIHPEDSDLMVQGNDGGATVTVNGGESWSRQDNQPTAELYQVAVDNDVPYRLYGAQQDNTTISVPSALFERPLDPKQNWLETAGCETGPVVPDPANPNRVYAGCKGRHSVFDRSTGEVQQFWVYPHFNYGHDTREMPYRFQRVAPMIVSPHDPAVLFHGSHVVHTSRDSGRNWRTISPDLTAFEDETQGYSGGPITHDITGEEIYSALYALAESPLEAGTLWAGSNDGPLHITTDAGETWRDVTPGKLARVEVPGGGRVNSIHLSAHQEGRAWVAIYRYLLDDWRPWLFSTDDHGSTWTHQSGPGSGIPQDNPVRVVVEDPRVRGLVYLGTERGIYVSLDGGSNWHEFQLNLPATPITGMMVKDRDLVLSTMGRSFWILDDLEPLRAAAREVAAGSASEEQAVALLTPAPAFRKRALPSLERSFPGRAPQYPVAPVTLRYWLGSDLEGGESLALEVLDAAGEVVKSWRHIKEALPEPADETAAPSAASQSTDDATGALDGDAESLTPADIPATRGLHAVPWDLRLEGAPGGLHERRAVQGPMILPGDYELRLSRAADSSSDPQVSRATLTVLRNPHTVAAGIGRDDLEEQFELARRVVAMIDRGRAGVRRAESVRQQLGALVGRFEAAKQFPDLASEAADLAAQVEAAEGILVQVERGKVGAELEPQLDSQLTYLLGSILGADQPPGEDSKQRANDVEEELDAALGALDQVLDEVREFDRVLAEKGVGAILLPVAE